MAKHTPDAIRNVALVGHSDTGKTTLCEHLLFKAGAVSRVGSVNEGTTTTDFSEDEKSRKQSIDLGMAHYVTDGTLVNLLDAPGAPDFIGDALTGLAAAEAAMICISATAGPVVTTRRMSREALDRGIGRIVVVTKCDGDNIDLEALVASIQNALGSECAPLSWPDGTGGGLSSVVNLFHDTGLEGRAAELREALIERIVESDEALMEKYFEGEVDESQLVEVLPKAVAAGTLVPILFCALDDAGHGVDHVARAIIECVNSPAAAGAVSGKNGDDDVERTPDADGPFAARCFTLQTDDFVGRISFLKIISGTLDASDTVWNPELDDKPAKMGSMFLVQGKEHTEVGKATPGMIVGITKVEQTSVGCTLADPNNPVVFPPIRMPKPMCSMALSPKSAADEQKLGQALRKLIDEKPTFVAKRNDRTRELVASAVSDLHMKLMLDRLKERYKVEVDTRMPRIAYLETITKPAKAQYRHKKQTGGRGQFGEVHIEIAPLPRGEEFEFDNAIVGGVIPSQYIPAVEKGIKGQMESGVVAGYKMVDVKVRLYDGKAHNVDSSEEAFKRAGSEAFKLAVKSASAQLLEPICKVEVTIPNDKMGDINGDLNGRRGRILGMEAKGDYQTIQAEVPLGEMQSYSTELRSMTGGEGFYSMEESHYDIVPSHKAAEIIKAAQKAAEEKK